MSAILHQVLPNLYLYVSAITAMATLWSS